MGADVALLPEEFMCGSAACSLELDGSEVAQLQALAKNRSFGPVVYISKFSIISHRSTSTTRRYLIGASASVRILSCALKQIMREISMVSILRLSI
eukprot:SAG11_NODE_1083_length_5951_cov_7.969925_5_plen_96_part_00